MNDKIRKEFEQWRDEKPNQRYGDPVWDAWQAACASRQPEIDHWKDLESQAARFVEAPIAMRTHFTGEPPYVGWEGLGLALTETLDELRAFRNEADPKTMTQKPPVNPEEVYSPHTEVLK